MGRIATAVTAVRNATQSAVVVRVLKNFATSVDGFDAGTYRSIPAGDAAAWSKCGYCRPVTNAAELIDAEDSIAKRSELS